MRLGVFMAIAGYTGQAKILRCGRPVPGTRCNVVYLTANTAEHCRRQAIFAASSSPFTYCLLQGFWDVSARHDPYRSPV